MYTFKDEKQTSYALNKPLTYIGLPQEHVKNPNIEQLKIANKNNY